MNFSFIFTGNKKLITEYLANNGA